MSASIATCAPGKNRPIMYRCGPILIWRRPETGERQAAARASILAALHPVLEHLQRHGAVVVGCFRDRPVITFPDPDLIRRGVVARQRQPHQPARGLPRQTVAVEQHLAEQGLGLVLALLGGKPEPARAIAEI